MKRRVAIPVTNGKLSETFGSCQHYEIFEIEGTRVKRETTGFPAGATADTLPQWLKERGITDVITFKVHPAIINRFAAGKINLYVGVQVESPRRLIDDYIQGKLESDENIIHEITLSEER